jgi:hypothetical protein
MLQMSGSVSPIFSSAVMMPRIGAVRPKTLLADNYVLHRPVAKLFLRNELLDALCYRYSFFYYSYIVWRRAREPILPVTGYSFL